MATVVSKTSTSIEKISLLDRLIISDNTNSQLTNIVRDVSSLLNSRLNSLPIENFSELQTSLLNYGLPDFSHLEATNSQVSDKIKEKIKETLMLHEPRLKNIEITVTDIAKYSINFTINATFMADPDPISIRFDSQYQPDLQQFKVKEQHHE